MTFTCFYKAKNTALMFLICFMLMPRTAHRWHNEKKKKSKDGINDNNRQRTIDIKLQIAILRDYAVWLQSDVNIQNL